MILRLATAVLVTSYSDMTYAQPFWGSADLPGDTWTTGAMTTTPGGDTLFYGGTLELESAWYTSNKVVRYSNGQWDTLPGVVPGQIHTLIQFHDTLFIGGDFTELNGVPSEGIAYHDGSLWQPYGLLSWVVRLRIIDDTLYAVGSFNVADGSSAPSIAKRVGGRWVGVGQIGDAGPMVADIAKYQGELVMASNAQVNGYRSLFHLVNNEWVPLGQGIIGGLAGAGSLVEYQGDLYIGGSFSSDLGNAGTNVMRWDGETFHGLGSGIQYAPGSNGGCTALLLLHNDLLWVNHGCNYAGGVVSRGMASWDGTQWCGVPGDLITQGAGVSRTAFYRDTLFVSLYGDYVEGVYVNRLAKFVGSSYSGECSGPVRVLEQAEAVDMVQLVWQGIDTWTLNGLRDGQYQLSIFDAVGRLVKRTQLQSVNSSSELVQTKDLAPNAYVVQLTDSAGIRKVHGFRLFVTR